jgi:hypothetical protein
MITQTLTGRSPTIVHSLLGLMDILKTRPRQSAVIKMGEERMSVKLLKSGFIAIDGVVPSASWERELEIDLARAGSFIEPGDNGDPPCTPS